MPGLGIGLPIEGFYLFVPLLFVVFHVYALLQLVILARRIGLLKQALRGQRGSGAGLGQDVLLSPFAISQRLFGEPRALVPRTLLCVSIWLTLVLLPLGVLIATQIRFLPYHSEAVTWAHRLYIVVDLVLLLLLWPAIIHPRGRSAIERLSAMTSRTGRQLQSPAARLGHSSRSAGGASSGRGDPAPGCGRCLSPARRWPALRSRRTGAVHGLRGRDHPGRSHRGRSDRQRPGRGAGGLPVAWRIGAGWLPSGCPTNATCCA